MWYTAYRMDYDIMYCISKLALIFDVIYCKHKAFVVNKLFISLFNSSIHILYILCCLVFMSVSLIKNKKITSFMFQPLSWLYEILAISFDYIDRFILMYQSCNCVLNNVSCNVQLTPGIRLLFELYENLKVWNHMGQ